MKITTRCGEAAVEGLNEALLAKAAEAKLLRTDKVRADTTVVRSGVAYPTDSGLLAKASVRWPAAWRGSRPPVARPAPGRGIAAARPGSGPARSTPSCELRGGSNAMQAQAAVRRITGELAGSPRPRCARPPRWSATPAARCAAPAGSGKGRLHRAIDHLDTLVECTERVVAQTRAAWPG